MPTNKGALIRRQVLDTCLSGSRNCSLSELLSACNDALRERGLKEVTSENTILSDIRAINNQYGTNTIVAVRNGRNITYRYKDVRFSIYNMPLSHSEIIGLTQAISVLSRFDGMPEYEWLDGLISRFLPSQTSNESIKHIVGFDDNFDLRGRELFSPLLEAIVAKQVLLIRYQGYHNRQEFSAIMHPYYIKQYNNRWFLLGWNEERETITTFAFDRILDFTSIIRKYRPNSDIDFFEFFDDMIGVSRKLDDKPEEVRIFIVDSQLPYILSKPLHGTQRIIERTNDGAVLSIKVILNFELEQTILSLGEKAKVLYPTHFANKIVARIKEMARQYE